METKRCRACGQTKSAHDFTAGKATCKPCRNAQRRSRRGADPVVKAGRLHRMVVSGRGTVTLTEFEIIDPLTDLRIRMSYDPRFTATAGGRLQRVANTSDQLRDDARIPSISLDLPTRYDFGSGDAGTVPLVERLDSGTVAAGTERPMTLAERAEARQRELWAAEAGRLDPEEAVFATADEVADVIELAQLRADIAAEAETGRAS